MKLEFTQEQVSLLVESLDITLKQLGLRGIYTIVELTSILQNPVEKGEQVSIYEFSNEQVEAIREVLDITTKAVGLNGASKLLSVLNVLQTAAAQEKAAQAEATE